MLCKKPYQLRDQALCVPCGQCMPCRFNKRRDWTHRIMLESMKHAESSFLTLTYDAEHLPDGGTLVPRDVQLFIKRLRKAIHPVALRYFFVGEYGDQTWRPHYHAALFGLGLVAEEIVRDTWGKGHIMLGDLTVHSAQYIAGYVTKKMTSKDDERLLGRHPEFSRMSLRPGIGALAVEDIAAAVRSEHGQFSMENGDVPRSLRHGSKRLPLSRYLRRKLREELEIHDEYGEVGKAPLSAKEAYKAELRKVLVDQEPRYADDPRSVYPNAEILVKANLGKIRNIESRAKIFNKRRSL